MVKLLFFPPFFFFFFFFWGGVKNGQLAGMKLARTKKLFTNFSQDILVWYWNSAGGIQIKRQILKLWGWKVKFQEQRSMNLAKNVHFNQFVNRNHWKCNFRFWLNNMVERPNIKVKGQTPYMQTEGQTYGKILCRDCLRMQTSLFTAWQAIKFFYM